MGFFSKKKPVEKQDSFITSIQALERDSSLLLQNLKIKFNSSERRRVARYRDSNKLLNFSSFLEIFENSLLNNKMKPGFSVSKGLSGLDDGRFPIYKKLAIISNIKQKENLLKKDKSYTKYSLLFEEKNINKTLFIVGRVKELYKKDIEYESITFQPIKGLIGNLVFGIGLILFNLIVVYGSLLDSNSINYSILSDPVRGISHFETFIVTLLYGTYYIPNTFLQVLAILKTLYFVIFSSLIAYFSLLLFFTINSYYRLRLVDKLYNESSFLELLRIKIKQLEIEGALGKSKNKKRIFIYKNFIDLVKGAILFGLEKGFVNKDFTDDILQVLTLYLVYRKFPEKSKLTESFQNLFKMILDSYYSMLNGTNTNFNLEVVESWIIEYKREIESIYWERQVNSIRFGLAFFGNIVTSLTIIVMVMLTLTQGGVIERLIKVTMGAGV